MASFVIFALFRPAVKGSVLDMLHPSHRSSFIVCLFAHLVHLPWRSGLAKQVCESEAGLQMLPEVALRAKSSKVPKRNLWSPFLHQTPGFFGPRLFFSNPMQPTSRQADKPTSRQADKPTRPPAGPSGTSNSGEKKEAGELLKGHLGSRGIFEANTKRKIWLANGPAPLSVFFLVAFSLGFSFGLYSSFHERLKIEQGISEPRFKRNAGAQIFTFERPRVNFGLCKGFWWQAFGLSLSVI